MTTKTLKGLW